MHIADRFKVLLRSARPPFLLLTPLMIGLAYAVLHHSGRVVDLNVVLLIVLSAMMAALASNWLNEYFDAQSGLDAQTTPTPFSGGSKALIDRPQYRELVKWAGLLSLSVSVWAGLALVAMVGWPLLLLGLLGVVLVISYTPILNRFPLLCLMAPGVGYGVVIYLGSYWAMGGELFGAGWLFLPIPLLLVSGLLLLNQFPDADADAQAGRHHAVLAWGRGKALHVFQGIQLLVFVWLLFLVLAGLVPIGLAWGLVVGLASLWLVWASMPFAEGEVRIHVMAVNVAVTLLMPLALSVLLLL